MKNFTLEELIDYAKNYSVKERDLPIFFAPDHYARMPIYKDENLEIAVICFGPGQTSSVHDHQGSNCVIRVVRGKMLEQLFKDNEYDVSLESHQYLNEGDVSGLDGYAIHQVCNVNKDGTILLNFYSPPFA